MSGINVLIEQYRALILCCWSIYFTEDKEPVFPKDISGFSAQHYKLTNVPVLTLQSSSGCAQY